jgi:hypothetical protein
MGYAGTKSGRGKNPAKASGFRASQPLLPGSGVTALWNNFFSHIIVHG